MRLTTSPHAPQTHWVQVILSFRRVACIFCQHRAFLPNACRAAALSFMVQRLACAAFVQKAARTSQPQLSHAAQGDQAKMLTIAVLICREPIMLQAPGAGDATSPSAAQAITGRLSMARSQKHRSLDISLSYRPVCADGEPGVEQTSFYELAVSGGS